MTKRIVPITETKEYQQKREAIQAEINANQLSIDRNTFSKTPEEKQELRLAKAKEKAWRLSKAS
jgi:response regulator of citrate/malate metabolism